MLRSPRAAIGTMGAEAAVPLAMIDGKLALGAARAERVEAWRDGAAFIGGGSGSVTSSPSTGLWLAIG
jgi:hypothetical protein